MSIESTAPHDRNLFHIPAQLITSIIIALTTRQTFVMKLHPTKLTLVIDVVL